MTLSHTTLARLVIAGIAGMVVGLFNNPSITQTGSLPPLALAFLVGYAADIFFAFLEGATQSIYKSKQRP
jgi:hypothetical protein